MSEKDVIFSKISIVKNCIFAIEKAKKEDIDNDFRQNIFELNLQRAIQACIDMGNVVLAKEGLGLPNSYRQGFELLAKHSVIPFELCKKMVSMVGFRNISVHDYEQIKPEITLEIVNSRLSDFEEFYTIIYQRVNKDWL